MASHALAQMLDELMGRDRNLNPTEKRSELKWNDTEVCKYFLVEFCPHELFVNTRADLGPCDKIHDDHLRKEYQLSNRYGKLGYEQEFTRYLEQLINDCEKRIRRGHQRLALNSMQGGGNQNPATQKEEKVTMLTERINELVQQAEELGCEGKVEEAQGIMKLCDQLNEERDQLQNQNPSSDPYNEPLKAMEVCNVCGALLVVGDAQQRVDEHIMGKQHSGYARIRSYVEGKKLKSKEEENEREAKLKAEREEREKEREKEREERKKREEERRKEREEREKEREARREKEREKRKRSRSRSRRSRSRDRKKRSRSRSRGHRRRSRSKSRDRHKRRHRSRSRDRKRSRSRDRKHRSRSRDRSKRKSSKDRSRSKERNKDKEADKNSTEKPTEKPTEVKVEGQEEGQAEGQATEDQVQEAEQNNHGNEDGEVADGQMESGEIPN